MKTRFSLVNHLLDLVHCLLNELKHPFKTVISNVLLLIVKHFICCQFPRGYFYAHRLVRPLSPVSIKCLLAKFAQNLYQSTYARLHLPRFHPLF